MVCEKCHKEMPDGIKICPFCGFQLSKKKEPEKPPSSEKARFDPNDKAGKQFAEELKSKMQ